jgi:peroxiredoxin
MKRTALIGIAAIAAAATLVNARPNSSVEIGKAAPSFSLPSTAGKTVGLSDYKGKYVVLEWTNHDCPFVVKHYSSGNMQATQKWAKEKGVVWLSIVSSAPGKQGHVTAEQGNQIMKEKGFHSTAMLLDPEGKVGMAYGAKTTPHMYVIEPNGNLIYMGGIDDKRTPTPADVKTARNHVKAALEEALAGKAVTVPTSQPYGCSVKYP